MSTRAIVPNGDGEGSLGVKGLAFGAMYTKTAEVGASDERVATTAFVMTAIKNAMLAAFPVGTVISTSNSANPSTYLGGTWEQFAQGRTLVGAGTGTDSNNLAMTFNAGDVGGEYKHQLSVREMPSHGHMVQTWNSIASGHAKVFRNGAYTEYSNAAYFQPSGTWNKTAGNGNNAPQNGYGDPAGTTDGTGGSASHNITQPYKVVYYFRRIS